jgi:hypothetical protein
MAGIGRREELGVVFSGVLGGEGGLLSFRVRSLSVAPSNLPGEEKRHETPTSFSDRANRHLKCDVSLTNSNNRRYIVKRSIFVVLALALLLIAAVGGAAVAAPNSESINPGVGSTNASSNHVMVPLKPVGGSGVHGSVDLRQLPTSGTHIDVTAKGLNPGDKYVSLYYGNHSCRFEPYSNDDIIGGGRYTANQNGVGHTAGDATDDLKKINSVSVRVGSTFKLLACADVHP